MPAFSCFVPTNNFDTLPRRSAKPPFLPQSASPAPATKLQRKPSGYDGRRRSSAPPGSQQFVQRKRVVSKDSISEPSDFVHVGHGDSKPHQSRRPEVLAPVVEAARSPRPTSKQQIYSNLPLESKSTPNLARLSTSTSTPLISPHAGEATTAPMQQQRRKPPPPVTQSIICQAGSFAVISSANHPAPFSLPPPLPHSTLKLSNLFLPDDSTPVHTFNEKKVDESPAASEKSAKDATDVEDDLRKPNPPFANNPPPTNSTQLRWDSALLDIENALR